MNCILKWYICILFGYPIQFRLLLWFNYISNQISKIYYKISNKLTKTLATTSNQLSKLTNTGSDQNNKSSFFVSSYFFLFSYSNFI